MAQSVLIEIKIKHPALLRITKQRVNLNLGNAHAYGFCMQRTLTFKAQSYLQFIYKNKIIT